MRINQKTLNTTLARIARRLGLPENATSFETNRKPRIQFNVGAFQLDYYNGYELQRIVNEAGGVDVISGARMPASAMHAYLRGMEEGARLMQEKVNIEGAGA